MQELELTSARLLRLWWALTWRFAALFFVLASIILAVSGLIGMVMLRSGGMPEDLVAHKMGRVLVTACLCGLPLAGLAATRLALRGHFSSFRVVLVPREEPAAPAPAVG